MGVSHSGQERDLGVSGTRVWILTVTSQLGDLGEVSKFPQAISKMELTRELTSDGVKSWKQ